MAVTTSLFASLLQGVGLSNGDAAALLGVSAKTVGHWSSGLRQPPTTACDAVLALASEQATAAARIAAAWPKGRSIDPATIEASVDAKGWPSRGAALAVARRAWERLASGEKGA